jgi:hypothetical protein
MWHAWGDSNTYRVLVRKREGKRPIRRPRHKWENYIKIYRKDVEREGAFLIYVVPDTEKGWALVRTVMNLRIP